MTINQQLEADAPIEPGPAATAALKHLTIGQVIGLLKTHGDVEAMHVANVLTEDQPATFPGATPEDYCKLAFLGLVFSQGRTGLRLTAKGYAWSRTIAGT